MTHVVYILNVFGVGCKWLWLGWRGEKKGRATEVSRGGGVYLKDYHKSTEIGFFECGLEGGRTWEEVILGCRTQGEKEGKRQGGSEDVEKKRRQGVPDHGRQVKGTSCGQVANCTTTAL